MVEDVVELSPHLESRRLAKSEVLAHAQIHAPRSWTSKEISFRDGGIVKQVRAEWWKTKSSWIEDLIARQAGVRIAHHGRPIRVRRKITNGIDEPTADVAWSKEAEVAAAIANPERSETGSALRKHVPAQIPPARDGVRPLGHVFAVRTFAANRELES